MKYVVTFSGGLMSALVAVEAVRRVGKENVILLNNSISGMVEHADIKRYKKEVAQYLDIEITYANIENFEEMTPLKLCIEKGAFQYTVGKTLCTYYLKTEPFYKWLDENYPADAEHVREDITILYGFDMTEPERIQSRSSILASKGYKTDFPLAFWDRTIHDTSEIGIEKPITYRIFKHANCFGCLKAGIQHWYMVYCLRNDIFQEGIAAEKEIGYSIIKDHYLEDLIPRYEDLKAKGICPNDKENSARFWARVNNAIPEQEMFVPCECALL